MLKALFAATAAVSTTAGAAFAGPYVNIETNAGYVGDDYKGATTDLHVGFEGELGTDASWYVQGGPAFVAVDGEDSETEFSGKGGLGVAITEQLSAYGELSFITGEDDTAYGAKAGVKFAF